MTHFLQNRGKSNFKSVPEWVTLKICDAINSRVTTGVHALLKSVYTCLFGQVFFKIFRVILRFSKIFQVLWLFMGAMINHPPFCAVLNRHWHLTAYLQGLLPIKKAKIFENFSKFTLFLRFWARFKLERRIFLILPWVWRPLSKQISYFNILDLIF